MISFFKEVLRQHYLILFIAIFSAIFWPQIKEHYYGYLSSETGASEKSDGKTASNVADVNLFTKDELSKYNGEENSLGLYLSIMGSVYDVKRGEKHYGIGGSYHFFAGKFFIYFNCRPIQYNYTKSCITGRDASVAFISGDFETIADTLDDVLSLEPREILSLKQWQEFYDKDYTPKGRLIGRFYDANGKETEYFRKVQHQIDVAIENKRKEELKNYEYPPCNIEWSADKGTKVWCTTQSGGIDRQWEGVPRKYFEPGNDGYRCACVNENKLEVGNLKEYDGCDPKSTICFYNPDD